MKEFPFDIPIVTSDFMPDDGAYLIERHISGVFGIPSSALDPPSNRNSGVLTLATIEAQMAQMWNTYSLRPKYLLVSNKQADQVFLMFEFPTLFEAQGYRTPWERIKARCADKMREIESYSSHKASRLEDEPDWC